MPTRPLTAIVEKDGAIYVAMCPELDIASQGASVEEAVANLKEAVELFLESADRAEVEARLARGITVVRFEVKTREGN
jgi:Uncharacterized conserved protein